MTTSREEREKAADAAAAEDTRRRLANMKYVRERNARVNKELLKGTDPSRRGADGQTRVNGTMFTIDPKFVDAMAATGAVLYGAPGGHPSSRHMIAATATAEDVAHETGLPIAVCETFLKAVGRVAQRRLLEGRVVGIPFVGLLAVTQRPPATEFRMKIRRAAILDEIAYCKKLKAAGFKKRNKADIDKFIACLERRLTRPFDPIKRRIGFFQPRILRGFFLSNMQFNGHYLDEVRALWENQANLKKQVIVAESEWNVLRETREVLIKSGHRLPPIPERPSIPKETPNVQRILKELREHCINVRLGVTPEEARLVGRGPQRGGED